MIRTTNILFYLKKPNFPIFGVGPWSFLWKAFPTGCCCLSCYTSPVSSGFGFFQCSKNVKTSGSHFWRNHSNSDNHSKLLKLSPNFYCPFLLRQQCFNSFPLSNLSKHATLLSQKQPSLCTHIASVSIIFKFHSYNSKYSCHQLILGKHVKTHGAEVGS